jgi:hypothetical protein
MAVHLRGASGGSRRETHGIQEPDRSGPGDPVDSQETTGSLPVSKVLDRLRRAAAACDEDMPTSPLQRH